MTTIRTSSCPICNNQKLEHFLLCKDYYATQEEFELVQCAKCKFIITQDFPSEERIGEYYNVEEYISHSDTQKGFINKLYHLARHIALKSKAKNILKYTQKTTGALLDIGSGTGYFLNEMKQRSWSVLGVEKDDETRKFGINNFGLEVLPHMSLFDIPEKSKDAISMWHVLEHIENLDSTIQKLHQLLKDDGVLFIALPNSQSYDAKAYQDKWAAYDVPRHLWHFSPNNFEMLASKYNFKLIDIKPMHFDAFYISMLSEKYKETTAGSLLGLLKGGYFFLKSLFHKNTCSSVIYILKKE